MLYYCTVDLYTLNNNEIVSKITSSIYQKYITSIIKLTTSKSILVFHIVFTANNLHVVIFLPVTGSLWSHGSWNCNYLNNHCLQPLKL